LATVEADDKVAHANHRFAPLGAVESPVGLERAHFRGFNS
jgi:hypothetical protein